MASASLLADSGASSTAAVASSEPDPPTNSMFTAYWACVWMPLSSVTSTFPSLNHPLVPCALPDISEASVMPVHDIVLAYGGVARRFSKKAKTFCHPSTACSCLYAPLS